MSSFISSFGGGGGGSGGGGLRIRHPRVGGGGGHVRPVGLPVRQAPRWSGTRLRLKSKQSLKPGNHISGSRVEMYA
jgi:hypothetical protein